MEENVVVKPLRTTIREMEVGETKSFPIEKNRTIKNYCSELKIGTTLEYATKLNRGENVVEVERIN